MKAKSAFVLALVLLAPLTGPARQSQMEADADLAGELQVQVVKTTLVSYSTSKVVIGLNLAVSAKRKITLEQVVLAGLRLNGLPLYAAPVKNRIQIYPGATTLLPDQLPVTVYLHDLDSVAPLRDAVSSGHATLDGTAYATVRLSPLAKVMLLSKHAEVAMKIHQEVPSTFPAGPWQPPQP